MNQCISAAAATTQGSCSKILDLIIIGGGLSGVFVAHDYHHRPTPSSTTPQSPSSTWKLLEARSVLGGRLVNDDKNRQIDLGGAWVWPNHQPNIKHLLSLFDITTFVQPDDPSSTRIDGGAVSLIHTLSKDLPPNNIVLNTPVTKCTLIMEDTTGDDDNNNNNESIIQVETSVKSNTNNDDNNDSDNLNTIYLAKRVVIAVPPRLISKHITFDPPLSPRKQKAMDEHHTWMAGVTKISIVYPTPFWRENANEEINTNMGLPTHLGPAFQVYDASTVDSKVAAITFFALVDPSSNTKASTDDKVLAKLVLNQLAQVWRYFGYDESIVKQLTNSYTDIHVKRWPNEQYISEDTKPTQIHPHPSPQSCLE